MFRELFRGLYHRLKTAIHLSRVNQIRKAFGTPESLSRLNRHVLRMTSLDQASYFENYAKIFRSDTVGNVDAIWEVRFAGETLLVPLKSASLWLDWDYALTIAGHDADVKLGYLALLEGRNKPEMFLDVGTNYGSHSLIFLKSGVTTLSFEPNLSCHGYFSEICQLNSIAPRLISAAVGAASGEITIAYPKTETWLASADPEIQARLREHHSLIEQKTPMVMLDEYLDEMRGKRVLLKIDTEGFELEVLKGAARLLAEVQPYVYFEALLNSSHGAEVTALLLAAGYQIVEARRNPLSPEQQFTSCDRATHNFLALPKKRWCA